MIDLLDLSTYLRSRKFIFRTNQEPIRYLQFKSRLTGRQFRWLDTLQEHDYELQYVPGAKDTVFHALSRFPDHYTTLSLKGLSLNDPSFPNRIRKGYECDEWT